MKDLIQKILCTDTYERRSTMSVTDINRGVKEIILTNRYKDEIAKYVLEHKHSSNAKLFSIMGKAWDMYITKLLEDDPDYMVHTTVKQDFELHGEKFSITGEIDLFHKPSGTLIDNKLLTTSKFESLHISNADYERQLNGYRWLLTEGSDIITGEQYHLNINKMALVVGLRDFSMFSERFDAINTLEVPFYPIDKVRSMFAEKLLEIIYNESVPDDDIPPCSKEERWEKAATYPVFKKSSSTARPKTSGFKSLEEAQAFISSHKEKDKLEVRSRAGGCIKCQSICLVGAIGKCNFYNTHIKGL